MTTKIELEYPYSERWKFGYLNINSDNRRTLTLFNSHIDRSGVQYARYLMSVKLGRFLNDDEQVDHIDNDKTNDHISNLQILSPLENRLKHQVYTFNCIHICPICGITFELSKNRNYGKDNPCCSRTCGYQKMSITAFNNRHNF